MRILATAFFALCLHLLLGWAWTVGAGIFAGIIAPRWGWLVGAVGTGLGWGSILGYTFVVAPASTRVLIDTMEAFAGNIPGSAVVALTVVLGVLLGGLGGAAGMLVRPSLESVLPSVAPDRL